MSVSNVIARSVFLICLINPCLAQPSVTKLDKTALSKEIKYKGKFIDAVQWKDSLGENIVLRTETGIYQTKADVDDGTNSAALFAYHYIVKKDSAELAWRVTDYINACELDITIGFFEPAVIITDLDKDSIAEVWMVYQTACRGDVSPANMKIVMYEGNKKYVIKGHRKIVVSKKEIVGGEYILDNSFLKADIMFRNYGKQLWKKNITGEPDDL